MDAAVVSVTWPIDLVGRIREIVSRGASPAVPYPRHVFGS